MVSSITSKSGPVSSLTETPNKTRSLPWSPIPPPPLVLALNRLRRNLRQDRTSTHRRLFQHRQNHQWRWRTHTNINTSSGARCRYQYLFIPSHSLALSPLSMNEIIRRVPARLIALLKNPSLLSQTSEPDRLFVIPFISSCSSRYLISLNSLPTLLCPKNTFAHV